MTERIEWSQIKTSEVIAVVEVYAQTVQRNPLPYLFFASASQFLGQDSIVWQSFSLFVLCNNDSKWPQKSDVTIAVWFKQQKSTF